MQRLTGPSTFGSANPGLPARKTLAAVLALGMLLLLAVPVEAAVSGIAAGAAKGIGHAELPIAAALGLDDTDHLAADAARPSISIYDSPDATVARESMSNPTHEGVQLIFGVIEERGEWLHVRLPKRPNGSTGWIRTADVRVRKVPNRIVIDKSDYMLRAYKGDQMLMEVPAGVGTSRTPTPVGEFFVDISVPFGGSSPYGAHMLSISGFSEVHLTFGGGIGQLAIHGTNAPSSVGVNSSNGCIRLHNESILKLKDLAPPGTPVTIQA